MKNVGILLLPCLLAPLVLLLHHTVHLQEISLLFICLTAVGVYGGMGVWWTMPTTFLSGAARSRCNGAY